MNNPWYTKLGFYSNPFSIKPAAFHDELVAYDLNYIYIKIDNGEMLFIDGTFGTGKTTILKNIINRYKGNRKVIYYNFNKAEKELNLTKLLDGAGSIINRVIGVKPQNVILLLDEVTSISKSDGNSILRFYESGNIKSVILVNHDYYSVKLPAEIESQLEGNVIRTAQLSLGEAVTLIRKRIGDIHLLSDAMIKKIFELSTKNPRKLLENCEDICKCAVEAGSSTVESEHIYDALGLKNPKSVSAKKSRAKKESKPFEQKEALVTDEPGMAAEAVETSPVIAKEKKKRTAPKKKAAAKTAVTPKRQKPLVSKNRGKNTLDLGVQKQAISKRVVSAAKKGVEKTLDLEVQEPVLNEKIESMQQIEEPEENKEFDDKKVKKFKKNRLLDDTHGASIVPNEAENEENAVPAQDNASEPQSENKENNRKKGKDVPEYNIVFYN
ncbi:MAG: AAA family ATPase [archaeon]